MIKLIEEISMNALPALQTLLYDGWIVRLSDSYSKRGNSVYALHPSKENIDSKIDRCEQIYTYNKKDTVFKISEDPISLELDLKLEKRRYAKAATTDVMFLDMIEDYNDEANVEVLLEMNEKWINNFTTLSKKNKQDSITVRRIKENIKSPVICASIYDKKCIAVGLGVVERDFLGIYDVYVDESYRKQGFGKKIMKKLLYEGSKMGVKNSYLQVEASNEPAKKLYLNLGYKDIYKYWYRIK